MPIHDDQGRRLREIQVFDGAVFRKLREVWEWTGTDFRKLFSALAKWSDDFDRPDTTGVPAGWQEIPNRGHSPMLIRSNRLAPSFTGLPLGSVTNCWAAFSQPVATDHHELICTQTAAPTGTTFGNYATSRVLAASLDGDYGYGFLSFSGNYDRSIQKITPSEWKALAMNGKAVAVGTRIIMTKLGGTISVYLNGALTMATDDPDAPRGPAYRHALVNGTAVGTSQTNANSGPTTDDFVFRDIDTGTAMSMYLTANFVGAAANTDYPLNTWTPRSECPNTRISPDGTGFLIQKAGTVTVDAMATVLDAFLTTIRVGVYLNGVLMMESSGGSGIQMVGYRTPAFPVAVGDVVSLRVRGGTTAERRTFVAGKAKTEMTLRYDTV